MVEQNDKEQKTFQYITNNFSNIKPKIPITT